MGRIVWLASYPKSGNTWVRAFLTSYLSRNGEPADINSLLGPIASSRRMFDELAGVEASDLTAREIADHRADVYRLLAAETAGNLFLKVHDAAFANGIPVFPRDADSVVIYIVRHPLDVVISLANHLEQPVSSAVEHVSKGLILASEGPQLKSQLEQVVLSWGAHIRSWVDESGLPVVCVRYEDLVADAAGSFSRILEGIGEAVDEHRVARAIDHSAFKNLQNQEKQSGFAERSATLTPFFRSGRTNQWLDVLTEEQVERVKAANHHEMRRFSYLT